MKGILMKKLLSILTLSLIMLGLQAQTSKITTGAVAIQNGDLEKGIQSLEEGLAKPELIKKPKNIAKGYFYLQQAYTQAAQNEELKAKYPDAILKAADALKKAEAHPELAKTLRSQLEGDNGPKYNIWALAYNQGVSVFNEGDYAKGLEYFEIAKEFNPSHFLTNRMLGSNYLLVGDTAKSVGMLENAIEVFNEQYVTSKLAELNKANEEVYKQDLGQMSYVYQQLAVIYQAQGDTRKALNTLTTASELLPDDESIKRQELGIYQQNPELLSEAEAKFKSMIEKDPSDTRVVLAYASLLDKAEKSDEAIKLYEQAYEIDKESLQANYGIGAYYINKAAELSQEKGKMTKEDEIAEMDKKIVALIEKAYPHMVWLHEAQPEEKEWLIQLSSITPILGKDDESEMWMEKLAKLNQGG